MPHPRTSFHSMDRCDVLSTSTTTYLILLFCPENLFYVSACMLHVNLLFSFPIFETRDISTFDYSINCFDADLKVNNLTNLIVDTCNKLTNIWKKVIWKRLKIKKNIWATSNITFLYQYLYHVNMTLIKYQYYIIASCYTILCSLWYHKITLIKCSNYARCTSS